MIFPSVNFSRVLDMFTSALSTLAKAAASVLSGNDDNLTWLERDEGNVAQTLDKRVLVVSSATVSFYLWSALRLLRNIKFYFQGGMFCTVCNRKVAPNISDGIVCCNSNICRRFCRHCILQTGRFKPFIFPKISWRHEKDCIGWGRTGLPRAPAHNPWTWWIFLFRPSLNP